MPLSNRETIRLASLLAGGRRVDRLEQYRAKLAGRVLAVRRECRESIEFAKRNLLPYIRDMVVMAAHAYRRVAESQIGVEWAIVCRALALVPPDRPMTPEQRARVAEASLRRYRTNAAYNLRVRVSVLMRYHLNRVGASKPDSLEVVLGYSVAQLHERLASTMPPGYGWADYLLGRLHVDHIVPISVFNITSVESPDFRRAWALSNLQLLPAGVNLSKGARLVQPFQPLLDL